jgi:hypothetical protein
LGVGRAREDFEQPGAGVEAVVEAEPAFLEEDVAAHFASQRRAGFPQLGLDQRVAGFPHQRFAAMLANPRCQQAGAFDVVDDLLAGAAAEDVGGKEHQLTIRVDDLAVLGDDAEAVAVAVESEAEFGVGARSARITSCRFSGFEGSGW